MSGSLLLWVMLALCLFWGVGLHNRLMRLRARGFDALGSVEKHMRAYAELVRQDLAGVVGTQSDPSTSWIQSDDWSTVLAALQVFEGALKDAHAGGLRTEVLAHLGQSFDAVQTAWHRLSDTPPDLAGPLVPAAIRSKWDSVAQRADTARGGFNQILVQYNDALRQFPARLVVRWMGFKPGGTI